MKRIFFLCLMCMLLLLSCESGSNETINKEDQSAYTDSGDASEVQYSNEVISHEKAEAFVDNKESDKYNYSEAVSYFGSTGKLLNGRIQKYEWVTDESEFLHIYFFNEVTPNASYNVSFLDSYSADTEYLKTQYKSANEYLYKAFYSEKYDTFDEFYSWWNTELEWSDLEGDMGILQHNVDYEPLKNEIEKEYSDSRVKLSDVLKLREGMTYYEAVKLLKSTGKTVDSAMATVEWVIEGDMYLHVTFVNILQEQYSYYEGFIMLYPSIDWFPKDYDRIKDRYPDYNVYEYESEYYKYFETYEEFVDIFNEKGDGFIAYMKENYW
ncbi:MAG: hypothetical protein E7615_04465 [Ruminococcaceae bacterium]|nr:hypothetical protein [Oscillospiraceae bacterium]